MATVKEMKATARSRAGRGAARAERRAGRVPGVVYGDGKPTRLANLSEGIDLRQPPGSLPVAEGIPERVFTVPWFKKNRPELIREHAAAIRKVVEHVSDLVSGDSVNPPNSGNWSTSRAGRG